MKRAVELLAAVAGRPEFESSEAKRWADAMRDAGATSPEIVNAVARAPKPETSATVGRAVMLLGIVIASLVTARGIWLMNAAPGAKAMIPWWAPLIAAAPGVAIVFEAALRARRDARQAAFHSAARLGLELLRHRVPIELAIDVAAYVYELDDPARRALAHPAPAVDSSVSIEQRAAAALAVHAGVMPSSLKPLGATLLAAGLLLAALILLGLLFFDVLTIDAITAALAPNDP